MRLAYSSLALVVVLVAAIPGCLKLGNQSGDTTGSGGTGGGSTGEGPAVTGSLGTFDVDAKLTGTSCGVGALGMANEWTFVVGIGRDDMTGVCTWDVGGGPIAGTCNGSDMLFDASLIIDMRKGDDGTHPACSIQRSDAAAASLDDPKAPTKLSGTLTYTFTPTHNSNCADLYVGQSAKFLTLPCVAQYSLSAKRRKE
jgi:hypothetical protein